MVQGQEGVAIAGRPVADPVALAEQTPLPDHVAALHGISQVLLLLKHLGARHGAVLASVVQLARHAQLARHLPSAEKTA